MPGRVHDRVPYNVRVQFRNASSFLVAYSVNLSRGGIFLETDHAAEVGSEITLEFAVPDAGPIALRGKVTWRRERPGADGPAGFGVEFRGMVEELSGLIDRLVGEFTRGDLGINILILCSDRQDLTALKRMVKSIITSANVVSAPDPHVAATLMDEDIDLAIIDADIDPAGALEAMRVALEGTSPVPVVLLSSSAEIREEARAAGAAEVAPNPPQFQEFRRLLVRALGRPQRIAES